MDRKRLAAAGLAGAGGACTSRRRTTGTRTPSSRSWWPARAPGDC